MLKCCPSCKQGKLERQNLERIRHVTGRAFSAMLPAHVCAACGESLFEDDVVTGFDLLVAHRLAEAGTTEPEALQFMRKATGLRAKEFAELLEVRPETVSRWEKARRPIDRATFAVLRQLIFDRLHGTTDTADFLRSLRKPKRLAKRVRIELSKAA